MAPPTRPTANANAPQNPPLTENPSSPSSDSAWPREGDRQPGKADHKVVLVPAARHEKAFLEVYAHGRDQHHAEDECGRNRREEPERQKKTTAGFDQTRHQRMAPARIEPQRLKEMARHVEPGSAEPAKQLLSSVRSQSQSDGQSQKKKSDVHDLCLSLVYT